MPSLNSDEYREAVERLEQVRAELTGMRDEWVVLKGRHSDPFFNAPTEVQALQERYNKALREQGAAEKVFLEAGLTIP